MANLVIDIGNTYAKLGVFNAGQLVKKVVVDNHDEEKLFYHLTNQNAQNVIISNVATALSKKLQAFLTEHFFCIFLDEFTPLPIKNLYQTPETLGKDRLAASIGSWAIFPGSDLLTIDAGTCITYDILTENEEYLGGNIAPGLTMRLKSMNTFTRGLPLLQRTDSAPQKLIGDSTHSAMQVGAQWGAVLEMDGFIDYFRTQFPQLNVTLTGGDSDFFAKNLKNKIFVNQNLVLIGLNKILDYNVSQLA